MEFLVKGNIFGKCVLFNNLEDLDKVNLNNKVLVIEELNLNILPYLSKVNGIIVEKGSFLSHIFIFLREINIPVVKIKNATKIYSVNQLININFKKEKEK
ncbi:MAG: PEP-utilizing enzyme [Candidatus ainarchaeum sp.]|nr:PEP-utilizing enzyme [Candidatus ainarchaeum sp.]MDD3976066.1 PEP-utilizing enzyme [Candidatus ainarchaeum sp.]